jgi:hypothetical protein
MDIGYWREIQKVRGHWEVPGSRWVDNIKMDLREIGWNGRSWIDLAYDMDQWRALLNAAMNLQVP